jgi:hypothetical protein
MNIWRKFEFRGRDANGNPFVDFGFVDVAGERLALSSHMLREPLWVDGEDRVIAAFKRYYEGQGFSNLRYKVLWREGGPVDTPFAEGWQDI